MQARTDSVPLLATVRSLYVMLPNALQDVGLHGHAEALRRLPLSLAVDDLLRAADVAEAAAEAARTLANARRAAARRECLLAGGMRGPFPVWADLAEATAAESAAVAAGCAAVGARYAARHLREGGSLFADAAEQAASDAEAAALDAALCAAAGGARRELQRRLGSMPSRN